MPARLVTIGDSLSQGMISGSVSQTEWSFPAAIARCLGETPTLSGGGDRAFRIPTFIGEGGLPINLEKILRLLVERYGPKVSWFDVVPAALSVRSLLDRVEDYWERGEGSQALPTGSLHHNLATFGFKLGDCDTLTEAICRRVIPEPKDNVIGQVPEFAMYRAARRTLNPSFAKEYEHFSQLEAARAIAQSEGGIENLIFWLGSNNCLSTVTQLEIRWSQPEDLGKFPYEISANLWRPDHFQTLLDRVAPKIDALGAQNVFIATIPHVTIPPVSRGISPGLSDTNALSADGYYEYYTHFWIWDADFAKSPERYAFLSREEARLIDRTIDEYNKSIKTLAQQRGWHIVDMCDVLDRLAYRRQGGEPSYSLPSGMIEALKANPATRYKSLPDTRFLRIVPNSNGAEREYQGGVFGLDGFHPTTLGYGIVADAFLKVMAEKGVSLPYSIDWNTLVAADTLWIDLPENLLNLRDTLGFLYHRTPLAQLVENVL
ncbi:hypothetical protein [Lusitaniella coriacea]|uniref:hypothetical protein n=1 Tax=Lusitaniella coriacea TaxID=1983105 RepID=UPI003CF2494A